MNIFICFKYRNFVKNLRISKWSKVNININCIDHVIAYFIDHVTICYSLKGSNHFDP